MTVRSDPLLAAKGCVLVVYGRLECEDALEDMQGQPDRWKGGAVVEECFDCVGTRFGPYGSFVGVMGRMGTRNWVGLRQYI